MELLGFDFLCTPDDLRSQTTLSSAASYSSRLDEVPWRTGGLETVLAEATAPGATALSVGCALDSLVSVPYLGGLCMGVWGPLFARGGLAHSREPARRARAPSAYRAAHIISWPELLWGRVAVPAFDFRATTRDKMNIVAPTLMGCIRPGTHPLGWESGTALLHRALRLGVLGPAHMLRAALIVTLGLATPASADLWTSPPPASAPSTSQPTARAPASGSVAADRSSADGEPGRRLSLTVIVDPACSVTAAVVEDAAAFARTHGDVAVRVLLAAPPGRSRETLRALAVAAAGGLDVAWVPAEVRRRAPAALPAIYLEDGRGRGVRAAGRPPLDALWRMVRAGSGP